MSDTTPPSPDADGRKLLIVDLVGFDRRRVDAERAPFCASLFERYPAQRMDGQPTTEVWPALVCGANPGVEGHLLWHAKLRDEPVDPWWAKPLNVMPDFLVGALQLVPHFFKGHGFDLPAIPHWRRKFIESHRLKYYVRSLNPDKYNVVGGAKTMFEPLGEGAIHEVVSKYDDIDAAVEKYPTAHELQFLEFHCFDLTSHWYLDQPGVMKEKSRQIDDAVRRLAEKCEAQGVTLCLLIEHGQERTPKENHFNFRKVVHATGVPRKDYCYYNGVAVAKFWFRTDEAREKITAALRTIPNTDVLTREELNERLDFTLTPEWGELYAARHAGYLWHPNDYFHPLANLVVGFLQKAMRKRMFDPYHRGYHGYLPGPDAPSEDAWSLVASDTFKPTSDEARLKDFAPSMLHFLGRETPDFMQGSPTFDFAPGAAETPAAAPAESQPAA